LGCSPLARRCGHRRHPSATPVGGGRPTRQAGKSPAPESPGARQPLRTNASALDSPLPTPANDHARGRWVVAATSRNRVDAKLVAAARPATQREPSQRSGSTQITRADSQRRRRSTHRRPRGEQRAQRCLENRNADGRQQRPSPQHARRPKCRLTRDVDRPDPDHYSAAPSRGLRTAWRRLTPSLVRGWFWTTVGGACISQTITDQTASGTEQRGSSIDPRRAPFLAARVFTARARAIAARVFTARAPVEPPTGTAVARPRTRNTFVA
jgi:hypothetical protein